MRIMIYDMHTQISVTNKLTKRALLKWDALMTISNEVIEAAKYPDRLTI